MTRRMKAEGRRRKARRRSFITTTYVVPRWQRELKAGWKSFVRNAKIFLMAVGFVTVLVLIAWALGGG